jgi:hypothetical protein
MLWQIFGCLGCEFSFEKRLDDKKMVYIVAATMKDFQCPNL